MSGAISRTAISTENGIKLLNANQAALPLAKERNTILPAPFTPRPRPSASVVAAETGPGAFGVGSPGGARQREEEGGEEADGEPRRVGVPALCGVGRHSECGAGYRGIRASKGQGEGLRGRVLSGAS